MPIKLFPEIRLRAAGVVPPMVLLDGPFSRNTPLPPLGRATVPVGSVPMKFPAITLFWLVELEMWIPDANCQLLITNPCTVQLLAAISRALPEVVTIAPLSSIFNTVLRPIVVGLVFALEPGCV
jgi:hypothetical protein